MGGDLYTRGAFTGFYDVNKLYKTLDYRSGNTLNFNFSEKSLALVSTLHFVYEFSIKMFVMLYSIN